MTNPSNNQNDSTSVKNPPPTTQNLNTSTTTTNKTKTIYFVRHAESEENRRLASLKTVGKSMIRFSLPTSHDVNLSIQLLNVTGQVNTPLSTVGQSQVSNVAQQLQQDKFWDSIQLVAYSPLQRAKDTALGLLGDYNHRTTSSTNTTTTTNPNDNTHDTPTTTTTTRLDGDGTSVEVMSSSASSSPLRVVELDLLLERQLSEWIPGNSGSMWRRIEALQDWLAQQPETEIVCVGHSQFFKAMLQLDFKFQNCNVWQVQFVPPVPAAAPAQNAPNNSNNDSKTSSDYPNLPPQWSGLKRLYQVTTTSTSTPTTSTSSSPSNDEKTPE